MQVGCSCRPSPTHSSARGWFVANPPNDDVAISRCRLWHHHGNHPRSFQERVHLLQWYGVWCADPTQHADTAVACGVRFFPPSDLTQPRSITAHAVLFTDTWCQVTPRPCIAGNDRSELYFTRCSSACAGTSHTNLQLNPLTHTRDTANPPAPHTHACAREKRRAGPRYSTRAD